MKQQLTWMMMIFALLVWSGCKDKKTGTKKAAVKAATKKVDTSLPGDPVAGAKVYKRVCIACHAKDGRGNGGITGADLVGDKSRLAKDNKVLIHSITYGLKPKSGSGPAMPAHKDTLSPKEIRDALAYVRKTFGGTKK